MNKIKQGLKLTAKELSGYQELVAHVTEELLGNETSIERLSRNNTGLARSNRGLFNKIKNFISDKIKSNSKSERYRIAEYLFDNALKEIKEKDVVKSEQFDKTNEIRYTIKNNSATITKQDYETLESDIMTWYMNQKGKILTHVKNGYDYYFIVNEDADSNGYMFTILSKSKAVNIHERETYYDEVKQHGERFDSFVSDFRSEQENSKFHLLSADGRRAERTNRETNNREAERERIDRRHDSRNGFESGRNNQVSKKVIHYDFENRTITYKDGTTAKFSLKDSDGNELDNSGEIYFKEKIDIDEDFQKYYNPKIKSLLSNEEWRFWYSERAAYLQGAKFVNIDDNILIPVGSSKVVLTDIAFDNPYAKDVLITTEYFDGDAQSLIDYIDKGVSKYGYSIQEIWKLATNVYGETLFNIHNGTTGLDSENINKWESSNRQNDRTLQGNEDGNGASKGSSKTDKKISFSLKDSDGNTLSSEQQEYFKNSKVVDKDENLLKDIRFSLSGKEFIDGVNQETVNNFVEKSKSNTNEIDVLEYAKTTVRLVKDVENDISDISEYVHVLRDNDIRHIFNSHGTQTKEKYPISIVDIENIPYITANYDKIYYRVSNKGLPSLLYIFALPDNNVYYIEQAVQNYGGKKLLINKQMIKTGVDDIPSNYLPTILNKQKKSDFLADLSKARKEHAQSVNHSNSIIVDTTKNVNTNSENFSNQIKLSRKANPTYTLSDGQVKKKVANFTKLKVYSKVEAERVINSILDSNLGFEDYDISISGKNKAEVIDVLWKTLNTADSGKRTGISLKIADYIIDNAVMENIYQEDENYIHLETIKYLKPYLHKVDLRGLKSEIKYRYDTDNSVYLLWGSRKGEVGQSADQIAMELAESGFFIDAENEADIFFEMDRAYREAVRALKKKSDKFLADTLGKEERDKLRQDIAKDILRAFDSNGKKSKLAELIEQQKERAKVWKDLYYEEKQRNSAINNLLYEVGKIRDIRFGDFQNSTQSHNLLFRGSIERLSAIKHRGDLNKSGTRSIVAGLNEWYSKDNPVWVERMSYL